VALFVAQRAAADDDDDPPAASRASAMRVALFSIQSGRDRRLGFRVVNRPITTGDKLWTDNDARAELHIGSAAIRLPATLAFRF